ncbi:hypothetical protein [Sphingopyxis sp.]|uniref:hypothetical protein n=1 Tax=Sphingopyxis sp. TaxID=1908224 RepID=UPI002ED7E30E
MLLSPIAASAAPALDATRVASVSDGQNELEGANWLPILLAIAIIAGGIWLAVDGDDDPVSP